MPDNQDEPAGKPARPTPVLDQAVQDHLGQKLRAAYAEAGGKPTYLGDRALPPELEHKLLEVEKSAEVHEKGVEAVKEALGVPDPARERGVEAVREALAIPLKRASTAD
jgi:hypothetical protein